MLRAFGWFFLVFSLFSLLVHLDAMGRVFGTGALSFFAIDLLVKQFGRSPVLSRMRENLFSKTSPNRYGDLLFPESPKQNPVSIAATGNTRWTGQGSRT